MPDVLQRFRPMLVTLVAAIVVGPSVCWGQSEPELISTHKDWVVYVYDEGAGKVCYMLSAALESSPEIGGRAEAWVTVTHRPSASIKNEIGVIAGYDYQIGAGVNAIVDTKKFELFSQGDGAWLLTVEEESEMVADMKKGRRLAVVGISLDGSTTTDKYSLLGFTAAHRAISKACS